jgi:hypothetical protein
MDDRRTPPALAAGLALLLIAGCAEGPQPRLPAPPPPALASRFDPAETGTVRGRVTWAGELPRVGPLVVWGPSPTPQLPPGRHERANPNAPDVDAGSRAVRRAVVFLRGVDPARSRPWDHPPALVEQRGFRLEVRQGDRVGRAGWARRGDAVEMVSRQASFHALRAGGAAFFTLAFPDPDRPRRRALAEAGLVELSSGAGYYWMRAYLFVRDDPYVTLTDGQGRFELPQVPAGEYELVGWLPNWRVAGRVRDPESGRVVRVAFAPPLERTASVAVRAGAVRDAKVTLAEP